MCQDSKPRSRKSGPREATTFPGKRRNQALASKVAKAEAAAIAAVEAQLGEPLREDGPPLGVEFDPLPPGAFTSMRKFQSYRISSRVDFRACDLAFCVIGFFAAAVMEDMPIEPPPPAMEPEHFPTERLYEIPDLQNNRTPVPVLLSCHF